MTPKQAISAISKVPTRRADAPDRAVPVAVGGVRFYSQHSEGIGSLIEAASEAVEAVTRLQPSADRRWLERQCREIYSVDLPRRLFGALLGRAVSLGRVSVLPCRILNGSRFRVFVNCEKVTDFDNRVERLIAELRARGFISFNFARRILEFGTGTGSGPWTFHIIARAAEISCLVYVTRYTYEWPESLFSAQ
jgi:hypothetical protein